MACLTQAVARITALERPRTFGPTKNGGHCGHVDIAPASDALWTAIVHVELQMQQIKRIPQYFPISKQEPDPIRFKLGCNNPRFGENFSSTFPNWHI